MTRVISFHRRDDEAGEAGLPSLGSVPSRTLKKGPSQIRRRNSHPADSADRVPSALVHVERSQRPVITGRNQETSR